jgi:hypothetical protein
MVPKPGWKTTEFYVSLIAQILALLVAFGFLSASEARTLETALAQCVTAVFLFIGNAWVVVSYIRGRVALKGEAKSRGPGALLPAVLLAAVALGAVAGPVSAAPVLPWRAQMEQRLKDQQQMIQMLLQQRQAPAPILLQPLPIQGEPRQQLPIQGEPKQQLPIPGEPKQLLPIEGQPKQPLPIPGPPQQPLPIQGEPRQPLPPTLSSPHAYTIRIRALYLTEEK